MDYLKCSIINIELDSNENKLVHIMGDSYLADDGTDKPYRFTEYCFGYISLKQFIKDGMPDGNWYGELKQYVTDCSHEDLIEIYEHYENGTMPTLIDEDGINEGTPCGCYIIKNWM